MDVGQRQHLEEDKTHLKYKRGEYIYKEGLYPSGLFCLRRGKVMVTMSDRNGNTIITNLYKEVSFIGIADYITQNSYQTECVALSDVEMCFIRKDNLDNFINEQPAFSKRLLDELANQNLQSNRRLLAATKKHMNARLADALIEISDVYGTDKDGTIEVYMKRNELAMLSNMSVANAIRHLSDFQKSGLISIDGKNIMVQDRQRLFDVSQQS